MDPNNPPQPGGGWPPHNPHTPPPHGGQPQQPYGGQAHSGGPYGGQGQAQHGGYAPQGGYGAPGGGYAPPPPPPKKSSTKWWIFGCLGCGALIFIAFFVLGLGAYLAGSQEEGGGAVSTDSAAAQPVAEATTEWVNAPGRLHAELAPHFVPFTLHYPSSWTVVADGSTAGDPNFFKAEVQTEDGTTMENFAVGYFTGQGAAEGNPALLEGILSVLEGQLRGSFGGFERVSEETTKVDGRWAKGFRFRGYVTGEADTVPLYGRLLAAPTGGDNGAVLLMLATPHAPGIAGPDDVGEKGGSAIILRSIRFTGAAAPATDDAAQAADPSGGSAEELATRAANAIREYDGNGDGWLSGTELTSCECGGLDTDQDGRVTRDEVAAGFAASEQGN